MKLVKESLRGNIKDVSDYLHLMGDNNRKSAPISKEVATQDYEYLINQALEAGVTPEEIKQAMRKSEGPDDLNNILYSLSNKYQAKFAESLTEDVEVYNKSDVDSLANIDIEDSDEMGLHAGSRSAASSFGYKNLFKLIIDDSSKYYFDVDLTSMWSTSEAVKYIDFLSDEEKKEVINRMKEVSGSSDKYKQYSKILRDEFLSRGYKLISYINRIEDPGSISYIILDPSIIKSYEIVNENYTAHELVESLGRTLIENSYNPALHTTDWESDDFKIEKGFEVWTSDQLDQTEAEGDDELAAFMRLNNFEIMISNEYLARNWFFPTFDSFKKFIQDGNQLDVNNLYPLTNEADIKELDESADINIKKDAGNVGYNTATFNKNMGNDVMVEEVEDVDLQKLIQEIEAKCEEHHIGLRDIWVDGVFIEAIVAGDWKHDLLAFEQVIKQVYPKARYSSESLEESDGDWGKKQYTIFAHPAVDDFAALFSESLDEKSEPTNEDFNKYSSRWIEDESGEIVAVRKSGVTIRKGDKIKDDFVTGFDPDTNTVYLDENPETDGGRDYSLDDILSFIDSNSNFGESLTEDTAEELSNEEEVIYEPGTVDIRYELLKADIESDFGGLIDMYDAMDLTVEEKANLASFLASHKDDIEAISEYIEDMYNSKKLSMPFFDDIIDDDNFLKAFRK